MSLHHALLEQATRLAKDADSSLEQANLRRAVSSAYYALFHFLTSSASSLFAADAKLRAGISRHFNHGEMKWVSGEIAKGEWPKGVWPKDPPHVTDPDLKAVAKTFVVLQQRRHDADYDLREDFKRHEALELVERVQEAFETWERIKDTDDARLYLACFLLYKQWDRER